jgi:hypothetical protein
MILGKARPGQGLRVNPSKAELVLERQSNRWPSWLLTRTSDNEDGYCFEHITGGPGDGGCHCQQSNYQTGELI